MTRSELQAQAAERYRQVLLWRAEGRTIKQIAKLLGGVSEVRVNQLINRAKQVLGAN